MIGGDGRWGAGKGRARQGAAKQVEFRAEAVCETIPRMAFGGAFCACSDLALSIIDTIAAVGYSQVSEE